MVISEIRVLYNDENDLLRTVTKRIYENGMPKKLGGYLAIEHLIEKTTLHDAIGGRLHL